MTVKSLLLSGCLAFVLAACGSTSHAIRYYQLPDSAFRLPENRQNRAPEHNIGVSVQLAEPLKSGSLLYQTDAHTVHFAQNNLWAAPLDEALAAAISNKLNRAGSLNYQPAHAQQNIGLTLYFDRFQGRYTGDTEISGYARWQNGTQIPFYALTPQQGDGYAAMTDSLNQGLNEVARQIAR